MRVPSGRLHWNLYCWCRLGKTDWLDLMSRRYIRTHWQLLHSICPSRSFLGESFGLVYIKSQHLTVQFNHVRSSHSLPRMCLLEFVQKFTKLTRTFWPRHFDHAILSTTYCPRPYVRDILSTTICPLQYVHYILSATFCPWHFVQWHFVHITFCPRHFVRDILSGDILSGHLYRWFNVGLI